MNTLGTTKWKWSGVPGRDLHDALEWCVRQLNEHTGPRTYLEIGVDGGGSLHTVLKRSARKPVVTLIDSFDKNHAGHGFQNFDHIRPLLQEFGRLEDATMHQGDSTEVVPMLPRTAMFDLILVDGDHSVEVATQDLANAWSRINCGGCVVFDDCGHVNYPGLRIVLERFLASVKDAQLIEEEGAPFRNCAIIHRRA